MVYRRGPQGLAGVVTRALVIFLAHVFATTRCRFHSIWYMVQAESRDGAKIRAASESKHGEERGLVGAYQGRQPKQLVVLKLALICEKADKFCHGTPKYVRVFAKCVRQCGSGLLLWLNPDGNRL